MLKLLYISLNVIIVFLNKSVKPNTNRGFIFKSKKPEAALLQAFVVKRCEKACFKI